MTGTWFTTRRGRGRHGDINPQQPLLSWDCLLPAHRLLEMIQRAKGVGGRGASNRGVASGEEVEHRCGLGAGKGGAEAVVFGVCLPAIRMVATLH